MAQCLADSRRFSVGSSLKPEKLQNISSVCQPSGISTVTASANCWRLRKQRWANCSERASCSISQGCSRADCSIEKGYRIQIRRKVDGNEEKEKESSGIQIQSKVDGNEDKEKKLKRKSRSRAVTVSAQPMTCFGAADRQWANEKNQTGRCCS
jgi:hypothetical protein